MKLLNRLGLARDTNLTLGTLLERLTAIHAERRLVEEEGDPRPRRLTVAEGADLVARWAAAIGERIGPGDRVVIATPNTYGAFLLVLAASRAGGVAVPVNPKMRPAEIDHVIADSGAAFVIRDEDELEDRPPMTAVDVDAGDLTAILHTSRTTGKPKGAERTHRAQLGQ